MPRSLRRWVALAALLAISLQALWPAIAQARPADSISVPICSADGTRHDIELPLGKTQDGSQHCKLCMLGLDRIAVTSVVPFITSDAKDEFYAEKQSRNHKPSVASFAHPRAPPQAS